MDENLQRLEVKIENQGSTPQGKVSAAEWNILVAAVKALDAAGIDTETLAKYLKQYQYITTPELEELLKDVTENLDGVVDQKSAQTIEGLKDFINGFKIGGALVKYDTAKKCFIFTENVLMEKGLAWNSRFGDFTDEEIFSIAKAVDVDWKTIGKNASGQLYVINGGGEGGGGNYDPDFLHNYLTNNKYITQPTLADTLTPYAKAEDVISLLTEYLPKSGGTVSGNITAPKFIGSLQGVADSANSLGTLIPEQMLTYNYMRDYVGARFADPALSALASERYIEYWSDGSWLNSMWGKVIAVTGFEGNLTGNADTATKLVNKVKIWGNDFDGSRDVAGNLTNVNRIRFSEDGAQIHVRGSNYSSGLTDNDIAIAAALTVISGKVAIGSNAASEKLHVHGNTKIDGYVNINGKAISYNAAKNAFVLPANLLVEGGVAWNSKIDGFDVPTITDAVSIDGTSIIRDGGILRVNPDYIQSVGGLDENELANYLTNNKYITQPTLADTLTPYAKAEDVISLLTEYLPKSGGTVSGNITAPKFIGSLQGVADSANSLGTLIPEQMLTYNYTRDYVAARFADPALSALASERYIEYWSDGSWLNSMWGKVIAVTGFKGNLTGNADSATNAEKLGGLKLGDTYSSIPYVRADGGIELGLYIDFHSDNGITPDFTTRLWAEGTNRNTVYLPTAEGTLALTSDNVASATKLANPRTLWGRSFDGTDDISGYLSSVSYIRYNSSGARIYIKGSEYTEGALTDADIGIKANIAAFSGKVTIGGSTATEKLHVHGNILATGNVSAQNVTINGKTISYNVSKNAFVLPGNLLVEGGFAWNSKIDGFDVPTITDTLSDHERRIKDLETENETLKKEIETLKRVA